MMRGIDKSESPGALLRGIFVFGPRPRPNWCGFSPSTKHLPPPDAGMFFYNQSVISSTITKLQFFMKKLFLAAFVAMATLTATSVQAQDGTSDIKRGADQVGEGAKKMGRGAKKEAREAGQDVKRAARNTGDDIDRSARKAKRETKRAAGDAAEGVEKTARKAKKELRDPD